MEEARALGEMNANMVLLGFLIIICRDIVAITACKRSVREGDFMRLLFPGTFSFMQAAKSHDG